MKQPEISTNDINLISDLVVNMDSESEEGSSSWLDGFIEEELSELRIAIKTLD